jgi:hypothetical protein
MTDRLIADEVITLPVRSLTVPTKWSWAARRT